MRAFFFFNDTATTEIYTLSLHDALPIFHLAVGVDHAQRVLPRIEAGDLRDQRPVDVDAELVDDVRRVLRREGHVLRVQDRKSTRLNSSHANISYAVFCLKKKTTHISPAQ